ncbi:beta-1,4-galactosyltransferase 4 isoform X2 [Manduca sexta]|uniref:beta-1,4-galactosyltransferase 4 isoform X2 n=1 Tax=Manduca sexta TaxID=7130 RepID=UPI0011826E88|nr:beta-1,4-galactosyltransferase 4 isoform X2 [Manduca sexta]
MMKYFNIKTVTPLRMLGMLFLAATFLSISNYIFYWIYAPFFKTSCLRRSASAVEAYTTLSFDGFKGNLLCDTSTIASSGSRKESSTNPLLNEANDENSEGMFTYYAIKEKKYPMCPETPPDLGPVLNDPSMDAMKSFDRMYTDVKIGGIYRPPNCTARQSVAILVPYRSCKRGTNIKHLGTFLYMLHPFLMKQQLDYQVFVIEQANLSQRFNHGKLLNAGFTEVHRRRNYDTRFPCVIIHEPYIVPMNTRNLYRCTRYPKQLAVSVDRPHKKPYIPKFGGAFAISTEQFIGINGFSNTYWGSDGDYEDIYNRSERGIGKYTTIKNFELPVVRSSSVAKTLAPLHLIDGLTTLSYTVNNYEMKYVFTYLNISLEVDDTTMKIPFKSGKPEKNFEQYD